MSNEKQNFILSSDALDIEASALPLDEKVFGFPVAAVSTLNIKNYRLAEIEFVALKKWIDLYSYQIVSCRLSHDKLKESFFLEDNGFRFIEMVLHPKISNLNDYECPSSDLLVREADESDIETLSLMAQKCFKCERFHVDPRLDRGLGDKRYAFWVRNSHQDKSQKLLKILYNNRIVAFFVIEERRDGLIYWHLTAVNPDLAQRGMGYKVWAAVIEYHKKNGFLSIATTISARNPVINLYSKLNFRFDGPDMTFHWVSAQLGSLL